MYINIQIDKMGCANATNQEAIGGWGHGRVSHISILLHVIIWAAIIYNFIFVYVSHRMCVFTQEGIVPTQVKYILHQTVNDLI